MRNTKWKNDNDQLKIIFYYKNEKKANLLIKNNPKFQVDTLNMNNVIYKYTFNLMMCQSEYIGMTRTNLKKDLTLQCTMCNFTRFFIFALKLLNEPQT